MPELHTEIALHDPTERQLNNLGDFVAHGAEIEQIYLKDVKSIEVPALAQFCAMISGGVSKVDMELRHPIVHEGAYSEVWGRLHDIASLLSTPPGCDVLTGLDTEKLLFNPECGQIIARGLAHNHSLVSLGLGSFLPSQHPT